MPSAAETAPRPAGWLASAPIDVVMAFGWLPFYAWLLTIPVADADGTLTPSFKLAVLVTLSATFIHRHFVYLLFFGDARQRALHPRALWGAPLIVLALVMPTRLGWVPGVEAVVAAIAAWNIWHTLMQRYGIARAYAVKGGGGIEVRAHSRRELRLLWALAACAAAFVIVCRQATLYGPAQRLLPWVHVVQERPWLGWGLLAAAGMVAALMAFEWARAEAGAQPRVGRGPRLLFAASTFCLLGVFALHGPVLGYVVFGFAHSIEYVLFVHTFARRRVAGGDTTPSARVFGGAVSLVTVSAVLLGLFVAARQVWTMPLFVVYYTATSALHFFYDGLIWKMRRPEVRAPIGGWSTGGVRA